MTPKTLRREFNVVPRVLSEAEGTIEFVASDETIDCYGEIVRVNGWKFTHFQNNAPFVDSHDYSCIEKLLGQVIGSRVENNQLVQTVKYARLPGTLSDFAFKMCRDGFLKAVSVGFVPVRTVSRYDSNPAGFQQQIAELKLQPADAGRLQCVYLEQEQLELSQCILGANPNALAKAYKAGCLSEQDLDTLSAKIAHVNKPASSATSRADAEEAARRARTAYWLELNRLIHS